MFPFPTDHLKFLLGWKGKSIPTIDNMFKKKKKKKTLRREIDIPTTLMVIKEFKILCLHATHHLVMTFYFKPLK